MWFNESSSVYVCSGTLIAPKFVLTAGHCAHDDDHDWGDADSMIVVASYDGQDVYPWGYAGVRGITVWERWSEWGDSDHDMALLRLDRFYLAYSLNQGLSWTPINEVDGGEREYLWTLPNQIAPSALVRVGAVDLAGNLSIDRSDATFRLGSAGGIGDEIADAALRLHPAFPNPFSTVITIRFELDADVQAAVSIADAQGRMVRNLYRDSFTAGEKREIRWDGRDDSGRLVGSGVYYCCLRAGGRELVQRLLFLRRL